MAGYGTDQGLTDWLTAQGYAMPEGTLDPAVLRQRASDYIDGMYEADLPGYRTGGIDQERAWPRTGATSRGQAIATDAIPVAWVNASYAAAWHEANNPGSLSVSATASGAVKRKKIEGLEKEFFEGSGNAAADATLRLSIVEGLVSPFLRLSNPYGPAVFAV